MNRSGSLIILARMLCFLVLAVTARSVQAQRPPQPPGPSVLQATTPYTADQSRQIAQYGTYWADLLIDGSDTNVVEDAQRRLSGILTGPLAPSALFRRELSKAVVPRFSSLLQGDDLHKSVNALNVIADLRTRESARALQDNIKSNQQPTIQVRIRAAKGLESTLGFAARYPALTDIQPSDINSIVRDIENAAGSETEPLVQRYLFEAIAAAHAGTELSPATQQVVRTSLIGAMKSVIGNHGNPEPTAGSLEALYVGTNRLYAIYLQLNVDPAAQRTLGPKAASVIRLLVESATHSWESARTDAKLRRTHAQTLDLCEQFFRPIDINARPGSAVLNLQLSNLWLDDDQEAFNDAAQRMIDILSKPPYGNE